MSSATEGWSAPVARTGGPRGVLDPGDLYIQLVDEPQGCLDIPRPELGERRRGLRPGTGDRGLSPSTLQSRLAVLLCFYL